MFVEVRQTRTLEEYNPMIPNCKC